MRSTETDALLILVGDAARLAREVTKQRNKMSELIVIGVKRHDMALQRITVKTKLSEAGVAP